MNKDNSLGINVLGYISGEFGLGEAVRGNIKAMQLAQVPIAIQDFAEETTRNLDHTYSNILSKSHPYPISLVHANPHPQGVMDKIRPDFFENKYNIGYWAWELPEFPPHFSFAFDIFDEIWTPSNYTAEAIAKVSPIPVIRVSHCIDLPKSKLGKNALKLPEYKFIFLFMFDFGSIFERKNPLAVVNAFQQAFSQSNQDVLLVIKFRPHPLFLHQREQLINLAEGWSSIHFIEGDLSKLEVNALINNCDCYVSLHRAEGFGLTMAEAMFYGKPVIATPYSGNVDFMNVGNSFLVKYNLLTTTEGYGAYPAGSIWADPDVDDAARLMRYVFDNQEEAKQVGLTASEDIKDLLSPMTIGGQIRGRLEYISNQRLSGDQFLENLISDRDWYQSQANAWKETAQKMQKSLVRR